MLKQVCMMKRHPALSMDTFMRQYEEQHAKFGETLFARARRFVRRYVQPQTNPLTGEVEEAPFDVIMELWWDNDDDYCQAMAGIASSSLLGEIRASGERLFASQNNPAFTVIECESEVENPIA